MHLLHWVPVEAGIYRVNRVEQPGAGGRQPCGDRDEAPLPQTFVDYERTRASTCCNAVTTVLDVHTRVSDLYSSPHDQISEQLRLTIETIKERQESELINNPSTACSPASPPSRRIKTLAGPPTPDDLDELHHQGLEGARHSS